MLQEWGVRGMKAIDVYSLEPADLVILPQPVHGLIFCYPYRDGDWSEHMDPCPDHVWFANQVDGTNACGTVALMNILNNVPDANLGPSLQAFKTGTQSMNTVERGRCLDSFQPIKAVHNSFIRINEMMEDDLLAEKDHEAREKIASIEAQKKAKAKLAAKKAKAAEKAARKRERAAAKAAAQAVRERKSADGQQGSPTDKTGAGVTKPGVATTKKKKAPTKKTNSANMKKNIAKPDTPQKETPAMAKAAAKKKADALARARHHYVAYLPINGELWKLDGMDDQPLNLGPCDHATWLDSVAPLIQASMIDLSQESIDFSLLAVVQDPLYNDAMGLAANIKTMQQVDQELAKVDPDWPMHENAVGCLGDESLDGPSDDYKVTEHMIGTAAIPTTNQEQIQESKSVGSLLKLKKNLISQQKMLKSSIRSGKTEENERQALVDRRRRDFGPLIQWQLMDLIDEGVLDELLDMHDPKKKDNGAKKGNGKTKPKAKGRKR
jgi:ubiquitin carboxyl-terminal hydrolase L5